MQSVEHRVRTKMKFLAMLSVLLCVVPRSTAFIPNRYLAWAVNGLSLFQESTITHKDMSRNAVLNVAAQVLRDNPNSENEGSTARIADLDLSSLSEESLITAYYGSRQRSRTSTFSDVIGVIGDANADVDLGREKKDAASHFDSEQFQAGQNRLVEIRQNIVAQILGSNFDLARRETGRLFHTLQDFYSHSNWIENGNRRPYQVLGQPNERPRDIAGQQTETCSNCDEGRTTFNINILNRLWMVFTPYVCNDNIRTSLLTSGYHGGQRNARGRTLSKPSGKCSHGGLLDSTSNTQANGGINKDAPSVVLSPHSYLYEEAANVAQQATVELLQGIRSDVNNDQLFSQYLGLEVAQDISIAYVIDTTGSMSEELPEIQATIPTIRSDLQQYVNSFSGSMQVRYILVPFNDPDPGIIFETEDIEEFLAGIARLSAHGGGDEPEPSIGAIIRAIEASEPGSPIFVFTDASASDTHRLNEANSLILRKNVRISFALVNVAIGKRSLDKQQMAYGTISRKRRQTGSESAYEQLAAISGGQFLRVRTSEISELASLVSFSAVQSRRTILRRSSVSFSTVEHSFPIDSSTVEAVLSINGQSISVSVTTPQGLNPTSLAQYSTSLVSSTSYIAHINITDNSLRGEWSVLIQSRGPYSIQVSGSSGLSFSEDLFTIDTSSIYGYSKIEGRPSQGQPLIALITVEEADTPVTVNMLNLVSSDSGSILQSLSNLMNQGENMYVGTFVPPPEAFVLQLMGTDGNGYNFSHVSDTSVEASVVDLALSETDTGYLMMRPGENATVTLILRNHGQTDQFNLAVNTVATIGNSTVVTSSSTVVTSGNSTDFFEYSLTPASTVLEQNSSTEIEVQIVVSDDVTDGLAVTFTVVAESSLLNDNNFVTFYMVTTRRPPPEFTENLSSAILTKPSLVLTACMMVGYLTYYMNN